MPVLVWERETGRALQAELSPGAAPHLPEWGGRRDGGTWRRGHKGVPKAPRELSQRYQYCSSRSQAAQMGRAGIQCTGLEGAGLVALGSAGR